MYKNVKSLLVKEVDWSLFNEGINLPNELNTIFVGNNLDGIYSYNVNNNIRNKLFNLPVELIIEYDYVGTNIKIPKEFINPTYCTGDNDNLKEIIIEVQFCDIDIDMLYNHETISKEEFETGNIETDHSNIIINIEYKFEEVNKYAYFQID